VAAWRRCYDIGENGASVRRGPAPEAAMKRIALLLTILTSLIASAASADVLRVEVNDTIQPISEEFISRAIDRAAATKAEAVVIELRTPGGLEDSMRTIVEKIFHSPVPVIVFVSPSGSRAASAGFVILESADVAAMAPGTNTGAAHPVVLGGAKLDDIMKMKMENDSAAFMRSIAQKRGRNVTVAESAVRESKSFTEQEALQQKIIDLVAADLPALLRAVDGRVVHRFDGTTATLHTANRRVVTYEMTLKEKMMSGLMDPNVVFILFVIGVLAIFVEFNHPGAIVPGVVGTVSILMTLIALNLLPTRYAALALLVAAFILFALEAKFTSHGVLGTGGVLCLVIGGLFLVDGPIPEMRVQLLTTLVVAIPIAAICIFLMSLVLKSRQNRVVTGSEGMVGEIGVARTMLVPEGKVFVHGELWNAIAKGEIAAGVRVRVNAVNGLHLLVEPAE
jgi:membrane-bound serine protease (ClpP class)